MAALTAASWTLVITKAVRLNRTRVVEGTLAIPGTDTYPAAGIPLPTKEKFGFRREIRSLEMWGDNVQATMYGWKYDKTNHKLLLYVSHDTAGATTLPMDEEDAAGVPGARTWNFRAEGF